jgi:hypothetical protein
LSPGKLAISNSPVRVMIQLKYYANESHALFPTAELIAPLFAPSDG